MTDHVTEPPRPLGTAGTTGTARHRLAAYARLAKLDIYDYYLSLPLVWALLPAAHRWEPRVGALLALTLLAQIAIAAAMVGFDDITGFRDGSDAANYGGDAARRRLIRKPLVAGTLTEAQALRFSWTAAAAGMALWALVVAAAPYRPVWAVAGAAVCAVAAVQYSWGLKLSYHGFQEIFLIGLGVGWVLVPYGLLTGRADAAAIASAVLFGAGPMLFGLYSNTVDVEGDRRAGRITVATLVSARGNAVFIVTMAAAMCLLIVGAPVAGALPWWFAVALLPALAMHAAHPVIAFGRGDVLRARHLAIRAHRVVAVLLVAAHLAAPQLAGVLP